MMNSSMIVFQHQHHLFWFGSERLWWCCCSRKFATCCKISLLIQGFKSLLIRDKPLRSLVPLHHNYSLHSALGCLNCGKLLPVRTGHSHHGTGLRLSWFLELTRTQSELKLEANTRVGDIHFYGWPAINKPKFSVSSPTLVPLEFWLKEGDRVYSLSLSRWCSPVPVKRSTTGITKTSSIYNMTYLL